MYPYVSWWEHLQKVQGVQGSLSLHADQANLQYHEIRPDPEDLKARQDPAERQKRRTTCSFSVVYVLIRCISECCGCLSQHTTQNQTHRGSILSCLSLRSLLARRSTEPSVSMSSRGAGVTADTLWSIFACRTGRTSRTVVALGSKESGL